MDEEKIRALIIKEQLLRLWELNHDKYSKIIKDFDEVMYSHLTGFQHSEDKNDR